MIGKNLHFPKSWNLKLLCFLKMPRLQGVCAYIVHRSISLPFKTQQIARSNNIFQTNMANFIYSRAKNILSKLKDCPIYQQRMEYTMLSLKAILLDAEEKQEHNTVLRNWLKELQNVFYQIEDTIDELKWGFFKQEGIEKQVRAPFSCYNKNSACISKPARKMKKLCDLLDETAAKVFEFHLKEKHTASETMETTHSFLSATEVSTRLMKPSWQLMYPLTDAPSVYHDKRHNDILENFKNSRHGLFHIVGEAGMGKSTLAKFLYNDPKVVYKYTSRYWVCVKEGFDTHRLIKEVHSFSDNKKYYDESRKQLLFKVQEFLRERTFLLVFQDLSTTNLDDCSLFEKLLGMGYEDSKIIVTTRSEEIANSIRLKKFYPSETRSKQNLVATNQVNDIEPINIGEEEQKRNFQTIFKLERLSERNSFLLFKDYAFRDAQELQNPILKEIAEQIVQKCKGVPLAIKCLGSLLSSKTRISDWKNVKDKLWAQEEEDDSILPALRLCYNLMPSHLKHCFLHCSQLPNDPIFSSNDVIQLWMAHGLLHSPEENNLSMEHIGEKYFIELWSRCFVQGMEEHGLGYWFKLHPLIKKLAHTLAQEQAEKSVGPIPVKDIRSIALQVRNTVLPSASLTEKCISNFKCLRLLHLGNANIDEIPNTIGALKNLRYIALQGNTKIKRLPNSICDLQSLQTLILASCSALEELPLKITNLISLRYLWITSTKLNLHKNGVGTMDSLRFLAIGGCKNLENLFEQPDRLVNLETLMISDCEALKSLPNEMRSLRSLQNLAIWNCKQLANLELQGVEFKLQRFTMRELTNVKEIPEWLEGSAETLRIAQIVNCPVKMKATRMEVFEAVERTIVFGAVRIENATPGCGFEHRNWAMRSAAAALEMTRCYY